MTNSILLIDPVVVVLFKITMVDSFSIMESAIQTEVIAIQKDILNVVASCWVNFLYSQLSQIILTQ